MHRPLRRLAVLPLLLLLAACAPRPATPTLYQMAIFDSFAAGDYNGNASLSALLHHGDFGLGTLRGLDGELIILDGVVYHAEPDCSITRPDGAALAPFANLTFFKPVGTAELQGVGSLKELGQLLDQRLPKNGFAAVRIDGEFSRLLIRSVPASQPPYQPLGEALMQQQKKELTGAKGTLVALRAPDEPTGAWVAGWHFHFISQDKTTGGHALEASLQKGAAAIMPISRYTLDLPPVK